jgi:hypothetical protein
MFESVILLPVLYYSIWSCRWRQSIWSQVIRSLVYDVVLSHIVYIICYANDVHGQVIQNWTQYLYMI